jgi:ribosomal silencing factor RsfS
VVVHVFAQEEREYYDLERLWRDAPRQGWFGSKQAAAASLD